MADQFVGEIRVFPFNFAPLGWAMCNGQLMPISQNTALFSLLGTNFGGNGTSNFALPNLQGNAALDAGNGAGLSQRIIGETGGEATVALLISEIPSHTHAVHCAAGAGNATSPANAAFGSAPRGKSPAYAASAGGSAVMSGLAVGGAGSGNPHNNLQPYLVLNFCIALQGIFPARQ